MVPTDTALDTTQTLWVLFKLVRLLQSRALLFHSLCEGRRLQGKGGEHGGLCSQTAPHCALPKGPGRKEETSKGPPFPYSRPAAQSISWFPGRPGGCPGLPSPPGRRGAIPLPLFRPRPVSPPPPAGGSLPQCLQILHSSLGNWKLKMAQNQTP